MIYELIITDQAKSDIAYHKKAGNLTLVKKIAKLLKEIVVTPFEGSGKPRASKA